MHVHSRTSSPACSRRSAASSTASRRPASSSHLDSAVGVIAKPPFGRTGHESCRVIFGAAALSDVSQSVADETLEILLEHGVNLIDTAASYGDAELRVAPWLERHAGTFFLATKTGERNYKEAREEIRRS